MTTGNFLQSDLVFLLIIAPGDNVANINALSLVVLIGVIGLDGAVSLQQLHAVAGEETSGFRLNGLNQSVIVRDVLLFLDIDDMAIVVQIEVVGALGVHGHAAIITDLLRDLVGGVV